MKKVSFFFDKRLQLLLREDEEFKKTQMLHYVFALVNYTVELSILRAPLGVCLILRWLRPPHEAFWRWQHRCRPMRQ